MKSMLDFPCRKCVYPKSYWLVVEFDMAIVTKQVYDKMTSYVNNLIECIKVCITSAMQALHEVILWLPHGGKVVCDCRESWPGKRKDVGNFMLSNNAFGSSMPITSSLNGEGCSGRV